MSSYATAFLDWLACAARGLSEPAARAARATDDLVLTLATAGHVLDYDDTYAPGLAHLSAPTAPAALSMAAELDASIGEALDAYAQGFEAMGAIARASHPALYERGWHPTAVCGAVGAAVAAAELLGTEREPAIALALLHPAGLQAAFGSDGKSLQVGMAASSGVQAARLAAAGASVPLASVVAGTAGFDAVLGGQFTAPDGGSGSARAVEQNWIKAWPCCLQTHSTIEAADAARLDGADPAARTEVAVHPISLRAAAQGPQPADGLQAKFSIAYLAAHTLTNGPPGVDSFARVDPETCAVAERIKVSADPTLGESEAVLTSAGQVFSVQAPLGSPARPMNEDQLRAKVADLAGSAFEGALEDRDRPAGELLARLGLSPAAAGARPPRPASGS